MRSGENRCWGQQETWHRCWFWIELPGAIRISEQTNKPNKTNQNKTNQDKTNQNQTKQTKLTIIKRISHETFHENIRCGQKIGYMSVQSHLVTWDARLWVALKKSGRAILVAKKVFMRILDAIGCNLLLIKSRSSDPCFTDRDGDSWQLIFLNFSQLTLCINTRFQKRRHIESYLTKFIGLVMQPFSFSVAVSIFLSVWDFFSFFASLLSRCGPGLFFDGRANWLGLPDSSPYLKIVRPIQKSMVCTFCSTVMSSSLIVESSSEISCWKLEDLWIQHFRRTWCPVLNEVTWQTPPPHRQARTVSCLAGDDTLSKFRLWGHVAKNHWFYVGFARLRPSENQKHVPKGEPFLGV